MVNYCQPSAAESVLSLLPVELQGEIRLITEKMRCSVNSVSEIRLRCGRQASLSLFGENVRLSFVCAETELAKITERICGGSLYAFEGALNEGYLPYKNGIRVAVNTRARVSGERTVREAVPLSLVFRIPVHTEGQSFPLARLLQRNAGGMLIFSPPAVGKTTLLRDIVCLLSGPAFSMRVAVVDTRCEIDDGLIPKNCLVDTVAGAEKREGMEWALRTLSPQIIAADELGENDISAVCRAATRGVPVIATAHAASFADVLCDKEISKAFFGGAFRYLVRLSRSRGSAPKFDAVTSDGNGGIDKVEL